jgi:Recombination endonuclease VII
VAECSLARIRSMKLSDEQATEIKRRWQAGGVRQTGLAAEYGVTQGTISMTVTGKLRSRPRTRNKPPQGLITAEGRTCTGSCGQFKAWSEFSPNPYAKLTRHQSACKLCRRGTTHDAEDSKLKARRYYLLNKYGITLEQYAWLSERQDHKCALCGQPEIIRRREDRHGIVRVVDLLGIDHDHSCERHGPAKACRACIRGLLCDDCNRLIGFAEKKPLVRVRFTDYLGSRPFLTEEVVRDGL